MQHSLAARSLTRSGARFVRPSAWGRDRRLGLQRPGATGTPAAGPALGPIALGLAGLGPYVQLRARWRALLPAALGRPLVAPIRHRVRIDWLARPAGRSPRRPGATPAPWRD